MTCPSIELLRGRAPERNVASELLAGIRWAIHEFLVQPYSPLQFLSRNGRLKHHRDLAAQANARVLEAAESLGLKLAKDCEGGYVAYHGALVDRGYLRAPGFEPRGQVVDVGAQYGDYALLCAKSYGADVEAFEPLPTNFQVLQENVRENHLQDKIHSHLQAVGLASGRTDLHFTGDMARLDGKDSTPTEVVALDDLGLHPSILKVDVEGMEMDVLRGARTTIDRNGPKLIVETHSKALRVSVDAFLQGLGYRCVFVDRLGKSHHATWMDEQTNRFYVR